MTEARGGFSAGQENRSLKRRQIYSALSPCTVKQHPISSKSFNHSSIQQSEIPSIAHSSRTMISRSAIGRNAQLALRRQSCVQPANRRGLAAVSSGSTSLSYETADVSGVKTASRDVAGPTTKLAVVAKAGTRYQSQPGLTLGLEKFAFKVGNTRHGIGWNNRIARSKANFLPLSRTPKRDRPFVSQENLSFWEVN